MHPFHRLVLGLPFFLAAVSSQAATLQSVFQPDTLGVQVPYLEQTMGLGPARTVLGNVRTYRLGACTLEVTADKGNSVTSLATDVSDACNPDLRAFLENEAGAPMWANDQTFGSVGSGDLTYQADCLDGQSCGNADSPRIYGFRQGVHATNDISIVFGTYWAFNAASDAADAWVQAMTKERGEDYVVAGTFNCDDIYNALAARLLKNVRITYIKVGNSDDMKPLACK